MQSGSYGHSFGGAAANNRSPLCFSPQEQLAKSAQPFLYQLKDVRLLSSPVEDV